MDRLSEEIAQLQRRLTALVGKVVNSPRGYPGGDIQVAAPVNRKVVVNLGSRASRNVGSATSTDPIRQRRTAS